MSRSDRPSLTERDAASDPWSSFQPRSDHQAQAEASTSNMHVASSSHKGAFPAATLSRAAFGRQIAGAAAAPRNPFAFSTPEPIWAIPSPTVEERIMSITASSARSIQSESRADTSVSSTNGFHDPLSNHSPSEASTPLKASSAAVCSATDDDDEGFVYAADSSSHRPSSSSASVLAGTTPSSRNFDAVPSYDTEQWSQLCSRGTLAELQAFAAALCSVPGSGMSLSTLANDPYPGSGLVSLHFAAKEGKTDAVKWLVDDAGAAVDTQDREGETALHKAAMAGKLSVVSFLLNHGANANAKDNDGWTALHNACSRGYLDIVRLLIDSANADIDVKGGRGGWTALMNAASKGHLPVVRALTSKYNADPYIRNAAGETAFDVAAATFEVHICEVLERYEAERWPAHNQASSSNTATLHNAYEPLALHTTVPVVLHENQRLDTRLQTLAMHGGKPRWSSSGAARQDKSDRRSPSSMPPGPLAPSQTRHTSMRRQDVQLPTRTMPYKLRLSVRQRSSAARPHKSSSGQRAEAAAAHEDDLASTPTPESVLRFHQHAGSGSQSDESSHFWLCEWQLDTTHPLVDVSQGWQYAQSFDALDDKWSSQPPPPLERLLDGRGLGSSVTRALTGSAGYVPAQGEQEAIVTGWVRRRRWVRVMRRRLDIEFQDDLEACETPLPTSGQDEDADATIILHDSSAGQLSTAAIMSAQEAARTECAQLGPDADYLSRARALAGSSAASGATPADALGAEREELARRIARLVMAITELRAAFEDTDVRRRTTAEDVRKEYVVQLGQLRQAAGLDEEDDEDDDDDEEFVYPNSYKDDGASVFTRIAPIQADSAGRPALPQRQSSSASAYGAAGVASRVADLAANRDFRVPTREAPNKVSISSSPTLREQNLHPQWQHDNQVSECLGCGRRFTFFVRKHHCRRCGRIFCDPCSSKKAHLSAQDLVVDPSLPNMAAVESLGPTRICNNCHAEMQLPPQLQSLRGADALTPYDDDGTGGNASLSVLPPSDVSSRASELTDCPVCSTSLAGIGDSETQEAHVRNCLENGGGGSLQGGRYLVYKLPDTSPIIGKECSICMEDFVAAGVIARLPCLCYFHRGCIDSWFKRGRECPVHARSW